VPVSIHMRNDKRGSVSLPLSGLIQSDREWGICECCGQEGDLL